MSEEKKSGINWGGLVKGLAAAAAIVVGVELVFPGAVSGVIDVLKDWGTQLAAPVAKATTEEAAKEPSWLSSATLGIAKKVGGVVLGVVGLNYLTSSKETPTVRPERQAEAEESFTMREDVRKMQALMVARMKATGHAPAMAGGQGIG